MGPQDAGVGLETLKKVLVLGMLETLKKVLVLGTLETLKIQTKPLMMMSNLPTVGKANEKRQNGQTGSRPSTKENKPEIFLPLPEDSDFGFLYGVVG